MSTFDIGSILQSVGGGGGGSPQAIFASQGQPFFDSVGDAFLAQNDNSKYAERRRYEGLAEAADILNQYEYDNAVAFNEARNRYNASSTAAANANNAARAAAQRATEANRQAALKNALKKQRRSAKKAKKELRPYATSGKNSLAISEQIFSMAPQAAQQAQTALSQQPIELFSVSLG